MVKILVVCKGEPRRDKKLQKKEILLLAKNIYKNLLHILRFFMHYLCLVIPTMSLDFFIQVRFSLTWCLQRAFGAWDWTRLNMKVTLLVLVFGTNIKKKNLFRPIPKFLSHLPLNNLHTYYQSHLLTKTHLYSVFVCFDEQMDRTKLHRWRLSYMEVGTKISVWNMTSYILFWLICIPNTKTARIVLSNCLVSSTKCYINALHSTKNKFV